MYERKSFTELALTYMGQLISQDITLSLLAYSTYMSFKEYINIIFMHGQTHTHTHTLHNMYYTYFTQFAAVYLQEEVEHHACIAASK